MVHRFSLLGGVDIAAKTGWGKELNLGVFDTTSITGFSLPLSSFLLPSIPTFSSLSHQFIYIISCLIETRFYWVFLRLESIWDLTFTSVSCRKSFPKVCSVSASRMLIVFTLQNLHRLRMDFFPLSKKRHILLMCDYICVCGFYIIYVCIYNIHILFIFYICICKYICVIICICIYIKIINHKCTTQRIFTK